MAERACEQCGVEFEAATSRRKFCSDSCRAMSSKAGGPTPVATRIVAKNGRSLLAAIEAALTAAEVEDTYLAEQARVLAVDLTHPKTPVGVKPGLSRELRATLAELLDTGEPEEDELDALDAAAAARRKHASGE